MNLQKLCILLIMVLWTSEFFLITPVEGTFSPQKTIELAVYIDQYLYHYWFSLLKQRSPPRNLDLSGSSSTLAMNRFIHSYLDVLLESLNLIYAHPSLASSSSSLHEQVPLIGFHLAHTEIFWRSGGPSPQKTPSSSSWETAPNYLEAFCDFVNQENWNGNRWDHALLLTGVDLKFANGTNNAVAGISWDNSMCNKTYSCSVVEAKTFRSVMTAVHEIGHSLGMEHDGVRYNFKCPASGYIMSHAGGEDGTGKIAWSPCSRHNLKAFLATAPNVLSNQVACLNNNPEVDRTTNSRGYEWFNLRGTRNSGMAWGNRGDRHGKRLNGASELMLPGARFSVNEQCTMGGGRKWKPSELKIHKLKLCSMLFCNNTKTGELVPFHPALEGTSCAINKVCRYGRCTPMPVSLSKI